MQLAVIGLGTMGANLARNAARNGAKVAIYNRTPEKTDEFIKQYSSEGDFVSCKTLEELVNSLEPPRPILIMVKAGEAVDAVINSLTPILSKDDILIDGGNSHFPDTERRVKEVEEKGFKFLGMGVSGGEEGALNGPSMMPGGNESAFNEIKELLEKMSAEDGDGGKCVSFIGPGGAGHFVKMVHNGIEYAIMQLIAESYDILKNEAGKSNEELAEIFASWNESEDLNSFLMEITAKIFTKKDDASTSSAAADSAQHDALYLIDLIKDSAGQKGTGKWTTQTALDLGVPASTITAAVDARIISGSEFLRDVGSELPSETEQPYPKPEKLTSRVRAALELSTILSYFQGFELMRVASEEFGWKLNLGEIARIWRGGCIIRSAFLTKLQRLYGSDKKEIVSSRSEIMERLGGERQLDWRRVISIAQGRGIPVPSMSSAIAYFDSMKSGRLPQNLIQAQRDFFGAHTFERVDKEGKFHADWS